MMTVAPALVEVSVVVPVYACGDCIERLYSRISAALEPTTANFELVLVNDASRDDAGDVMARLAAQDSRVRVISYRENQGQHAAIASGLEGARGRWVAVMDCDLQDPPEVLPSLLSLARERADIVVGRRRSHPRSGWRRAAGWGFGVLARLRHRDGLVGSHSVFSVVSQEAVKRYLNRPERMFMYLPVLSSLGLPVLSIDYDRAPRVCGHSGYSLSRLARHAWSVLVSPRMPNGA